MNIVERLWNLAKEAKTPEESNAYMISLLWVEEYIMEQKEKEVKEKIEREKSAAEVLAALVEIHENGTNNAN